MIEKRDLHQLLKPATKDNLLGLNGESVYLEGQERANPLEKYLELDPRATGYIAKVSMDGPIGLCIQIMGEANLSNEKLEVISMDSNTHYNIVVGNNSLKFGFIVVTDAENCK